jgi:hypothetical protein
MLPGRATASFGFVKELLRELFERYPSSRHRVIASTILERRSFFSAVFLGATFAKTSSIMRRTLAESGSIAMIHFSFDEGLNMQIRLSNLDAASASDICKQIEGDLDSAGVSRQFQISQVAETNEVHRGADPATIMTVLLAAVGAGGALTVALAKDGFITRLAKVLETLASRQVEVTLELGKEKVHLSGSAPHIERILRDKLKSRGAA